MGEDFWLEAAYEDRYAIDGEEEIESGGWIEVEPDWEWDGEEEE